MQISISKKSGDVVNFETVNVKSIEELAKIITDKPYSLSTFKDGYRNKANFIQARALGLDFDEGFTLAEADEAFKDYLHIIAPTRSHQVEKNGATQDRFRVVLFLSSLITDADTFEATWFSLAEKWPKLDKACKDASRFFYESKYIHSMNAEGMVVEPVAPKTRETKPVDLSRVLPTDRGTLGKETLSFLEQGAENGGRNHATFKAAKDFQQNLYTLEETLEIVITALDSNGTIANDFTASEAQAAIKSAFNSEPKHEPRIVENAFKLLQIGDLYKSEDSDEMDWLVDGLLTVGGVSLISGDPKSGKSTIARQLVTNVLSGTPFFGRKVKQGTAHYYGIEEQRRVLIKSFRRLGVQDNAPLYVHVGDPFRETNVMEDLEKILVATKPAIAIIDTVFDLLEVESENNYKETKREFRRLRRIARESGTHIMAVHHNTKGQKDDKRRGNRAILGSTAISGGVDSIMVIEVDGDTRLITTSGREVNRWVRREVNFDPKNCTYSIGRDASEDWE